MLNHTREQYRFHAKIIFIPHSHRCSSNKRNVFSNVIYTWTDFKYEIFYGTTSIQSYKRFVPFPSIRRESIITISTKYEWKHFHSTRRTSHPSDSSSVKSSSPPQFRVDRHSALQLDRITGEGRDGQGKGKSGPVSSSADPRFLSPQLTARASNMADKTGSRGG